MNIEKLQEDKRRELSRKYETLIKQRVEESNSTIKNSLTSLVQMIDNYKITQKGKAKQMTKEEEQQFIQQTVEEILADDNMIEEVKNRLRPKLEARVRAALEKELEDGVELGKR
jgi:nucleotidyltransferase/DNA polymerase involved in DNA repair